MAKYAKFRQPQKIHPIAYIIGVIFLALIAVVIIFTVPSKSKKFYSEYSSAQLQTEQFDQNLLISKEHLYKKINLKDLEKKIDSKNLVIVYMGGTWCSTCLNEVGIYSSELETNENLLEIAKNIYYLEVPETKELKGLEEFIEKYELSENLSYPQLLSFYNGKLVKAKYVPGIQQLKDIKTTVWKYYNSVLEEVK